MGLSLNCQKQHPDSSRGRSDWANGTWWHLWAVVVLLPTMRGDKTCAISCGGSCSMPEPAVLQ